MHSIGSISALWQSIVRPVQWAGNPGACPLRLEPISSGPVAKRCPGTTSDKRSNQKADIAVSTRPFSGIGSAMTTSNAEIRSEVTINNRFSSTS